MKNNIVDKASIVVLILSTLIVIVAHQKEPRDKETYVELPRVNELVLESVKTYEAPVKEEEVIEVEEFKPYYTYTEEELDLLARCVRAEGETESFETKKKIASVVMNRVDSDLFPDTIREVIYSPKQFSVTFEYIKGIAMIDYPDDEESIKASKEVLEYGSILPDDVLYFYEKSVTNNWINTRAIYELADTTIFALVYER